MRLNGGKGKDENNSHQRPWQTFPLGVLSGVTDIHYYKYYYQTNIKQISRKLLKKRSEKVKNLIVDFSLQI